KVYAYKMKLPDEDGNLTKFKAKGVPLDIDNHATLRWDTLLRQLFSNYVYEPNETNDAHPEEGSLMKFDNLALDIYGKTNLDGMGSRSILRESSHRLLRPTFNKRCPIKFATTDDRFHTVAHLFHLYYEDRLSELYTLPNGYFDPEIDQS